MKKYLHLLSYLPKDRVTLILKEIADEESKEKKISWSSAYKQVQRDFFLSANLPIPSELQTKDDLN